MESKKHLSAPELANNPAQLGELQRQVGLEWADFYAANIEPDNGAEIVLRNPAVYLRDVRPIQLPEKLRKEWVGLLEYSDAVAKVASTEDSGFSNDTSGIEKIQSLMNSGRINSDFRGSVGDIMRISSRLFAESIVVVPGNTSYYAGNVVGMEAWFSRRLQESSK